MKSILSLLTLVLATACAPLARTLPIVSVGNTGCLAQDLSVFNYKPEQRSWTAVCKAQVYRCSDVGRRTTRCALAQGEVDPRELQRAELLRQLPAERRLPFITKDVVAYDEAQVTEMVAKVALVPQTMLDGIKSPDELVVLPDERAEKLSACDPEPFEVSVEEGKMYLPKGVSKSKRIDCINGAIYQLPAPSRSSARVWAQLTESSVRHWVEEHPTVATTATPLEQSAGSLASEALPSATVASAPPEQATHGETEVRAWIESKAEDVRACSMNDRTLVQAHVDAAGKTSFSVRGVEASDPVQGCVRAVLEPAQFPSASSTVLLHLVRPVSTTSAQGTPQ